MAYHSIGITDKIRQYVEWEAEHSGCKEEYQINAEQVNAASDNAITSAWHLPYAKQEGTGNA